MSALAPPAQSDDEVRSKLTILFASLAVGVVLVYRRWPSSWLWLPAAVGGITLAIWHGAYDTVVARNVWQPRYAGKWLLPFVASYVALASAVALAWYAFPVAALVAFLLFSGAHFGMETESGQGHLHTASAVAFGCLPIVAACHWQATSVLLTFETMLRGEGDAASRIIVVAGGLLTPCILLAVVPVWQDRVRGLRRSTLVVAQLLLFRFCPPVLAFAVFFCALHTPEHLIETSRNADGRFSAEQMWRNLRAGIVPWLLSVVAVAIAACMGRPSLQAYTALLFIALSALTVPHMALAMLATADARRRESFPIRSAQGAAHS